MWSPVQNQHHNVDGMCRESDRPLFLRITSIQLLCQTFRCGGRTFCPKESVNIHICLNIMFQWLSGSGKVKDWQFVLQNSGIKSFYSIGIWYFQLNKTCFSYFVSKLFLFPGSKDAGYCLDNICGHMVTQHDVCDTEISPYR